MTTMVVPTTDYFSKEYPPAFASGKQRNFLRKIVTQLREVPENEVMATFILIERDEFPKDKATAFIEKFLAYPEKKAPITAAAPKATTKKAADRIDELPSDNMKFAIPVGELPMSVRHRAGHSDLLFGEIKKTKSGYRVMNTLKGSPGAFARDYVKYGTDDRRFIVDQLMTDPIHYMQVFGEHYTVCGKCAAELTDDDSRARKFGPDCARQLGLL